MIIGISGKINSGKDTVGEIIHYLLFRANKHEIGLDNSFEEFRKIINKDWNKEDITKETSFVIIFRTKTPILPFPVKNISPFTLV